MSEPMNLSAVDNEIHECLNLLSPRSFFLFAGAGSGKTRSLVEVLKRFREKNIQRLRLRGQRVAIITYTNAACDEIRRRLEFDPAFSVSTIHSFAWELIKPYQNDIREWLEGSLTKKVAELDQKLARARKPGSKTAVKNKAKRDSKQRRLKQINHVSAFSYNPTGVNSGKDSLDHAEVISIASEFLSEKPLMRKILVHAFPILLIDESQDTNKDLLEAFFITQAEQSHRFCLGLFGDTMQRIYFDGKTDLGVDIPRDWAKPAKTFNYRSPSRIIELINNIRSDVDNHLQEPKGNGDEGVVRLFIVDANDKLDTFAVEADIAEKMARITGEEDWKQGAKGVKTLTLEHHMAAYRGGFAELFTPLYRVDKFSTGLLDGTLRGMTFFTKRLLPLVHATRANDEFTTAQVVRKHSPILKSQRLTECESQLKQIRVADAAVRSIKSLWMGDKNPTLLAILLQVTKTGLFSLPDIFSPFVDGAFDAQGESSAGHETESFQDEAIAAWKEALSAPLSQLESYADYISERSGFGTHQGVKGLEFPHVMIILDDDKAKGFMFSYEKLLGAKDPTPTDIKNEAAGKETGLDRTRRLFYVTCSRAEKTLAIVAYTKAPQKVKEYALSKEWFTVDEIVEL